ncbi:PREDICTED: ubiquitin carboxyl-terminal hydrolase CYLD-like [Xyrichtys novacula]|uniref:PREDICTED: ubiquitin carboxyl-terminal hydrolase CYLD-like n=1 Tax=Xyrichtys novacula TaxID=13765 RepID=A0AAV1HN10_XYRNO|nr:PREDICTED: ubiquitin carboxyl-terminal hydrolase CYLD-like [Xyrichtys novacula]
MERVRTPLRSKHLEVVAERGKVEEARLNFEREPTAKRRGELNEAKQCLFSTYDTIKREELMKRVRRVQEVQGEHQYREVWRVINEMTGRKRTKEGQVEGHSTKERVTTWTSHFLSCWAQQLMQLRKKRYHQSFKTSTLKMVPSHRVGKSAGPDGIPPEVLKNCDLNNIILEFCNLALLHNPDMWSLSNIVRVPKAGDLSKPDNYQGISLTCITAKVYNCMILNRVQHAIDPHLRENQNGFERGELLQPRSWHLGE